MMHVYQRKLISVKLKYIYLIINKELIFFSLFYKRSNKIKRCLINKNLYNLDSIIIY